MSVAPVRSAECRRASAKSSVLRSAPLRYIPNMSTFSSARAATDARTALGPPSTSNVMAICEKSVATRMARSADRFCSSKKNATSAANIATISKTRASLIIEDCSIASAIRFSFDTLVLTQIFLVGLLKATLNFKYNSRLQFGSQLFLDC